MSFTDDEKNSIWPEIEQKSPDLIKAFLALKDEAELKAFFRDLMSERDLREFAMRWEVAKMLDAGFSYTEIQEKIEGVSAPTIAKINRWLKEGCGGYKMMIDRLKQEN
jgi:TrpR-related protein YerC/YecD